MAHVHDAMKNAESLGCRISFCFWAI